MLHTYRKWKDWKVFYLESYDKEEDMYYCEASYYEDSWHFEEDYILKNSKPATILDIIKYKAEKLLYK